jgi:pSer/pThr/pTyr-binding forkhead associated (FHA) protein
MIVRVRIVAPKSKRGSFTVRLPLLVGRGAEAKFRIQHDQVSRRHCEFFAGDAAVYVRDLGSTNGTFLAGEQIPTSVRTLVPCGAMVRVGKVAFVVEYGQANGTASAGERHDDTQTGSDPGGDRSASSGEESFAVDHPDDLPLPDGKDGVEPAVGAPPAE